MNERYFPITSTSDSTTVDGTSRQFSLTLANGKKYMFISTVSVHLSQGANPTAAAADANMFWPANVMLIIDGGLGAKLAVIQAVGAGTASLTECR